MKRDVSAELSSATHVYSKEKFKFAVNETFLRRHGSNFRASAGCLFLFKSMKLFLISLIVLNSIAHPLSDTEDFFEGEIEYKFVLRDKLGKSIFTPQEQEKQFHYRGDVLIRATQGQIVDIMNGEDLLLSNTEGKRFQINYVKRTLVELGGLSSEVYFKEDFRSGSDTTILGNKCIKVRITKLDSSTQDSIKSTYFFSELKFKDSKKLAALQGGQNTMVLDGSYGTIPLRIVSEFKNGNRLTIDAISVTNSNPKDFFRFEDFDRL